MTDGLLGVKNEPYLPSHDRHKQFKHHYRNVTGVSI